MKTIEETKPLLCPIEPEKAISSDEMIAIMRGRINELIEIINIMRIEIIEVKKWQK